MKRPLSRLEWRVMTSQGKRGRKPPAPRASRAARTPHPGTQGGPFAEDAHERLLATEPKPRKIRADEAEDNFRAVHTDGGTRLQKVLASAGVASRRVSENLIAEGRVVVDGRVIIEPGVRVDTQQVTIHVDGMQVNLDVEHRYLMFNKPRGVVTTMSDPEGRPAINDYLPDQLQNSGLFHVGRLDAETEGLLLLTNDGDLAHRLTHPSYEVPKTYLVAAEGQMPTKAAKKLEAGIELDDGPISADRCWIMDSSGQQTMVEITLHSGRNRIVRRMFDAVGYPVRRLVRTGIGRLVVGDQTQGTIRELGQQEIGHLRELTTGGSA